MFDVDQKVTTPSGTGYVLEVVGDIVYVELTNGVEVEFNVGQVQLYVKKVIPDTPVLTDDEKASILISELLKSEDFALMRAIGRAIAPQVNRTLEALEKKS